MRNAFFPWLTKFLGLHVEMQSWHCYKYMYTGTVMHREKHMYREKYDDPIISIIDYYGLLKGPIDTETHYHHWSI